MQAKKISSYSPAPPQLTHCFPYPLLEIRDGKLQFYPGTYDEYVWSLEKGVLSEVTANSSTEKMSSPSLNNKYLERDAINLTTLNSISSDKSELTYKDRKRLESERKKMEKESLKLEELLNSLTIQQNLVNEKLSMAPITEITKFSEELSKLSQSVLETEEKYLALL